jgi:magnesium-transporting ATPase (P-type)
MIYFFGILFAIYVIYTLNFAIKFNSTNTVFNDNQILIHNVLIWVIPFFWIMIVKTMINPIPGPDKFKKTKQNPRFYESEIGIWGHSGHHHTDSEDGHSNDDGV